MQKNYLFYLHLIAALLIALIGVGFAAIRPAFGLGVMLLGIIRLDSLLYRHTSKSIRWICPGCACALYLAVLLLPFFLPSASTTSQPVTRQMSFTSTSSMHQTAASAVDEAPIYITRTGKKYHHNPQCNSATYYLSTLEEALRSELLPCKKCVL